MALIEIKNLDKIYNTTAVAVHAVKDVSLNIEKKEFTAIVGPSGSGKTTLLNVIGGLDKPTKGSVVIDNVDVSSLSSGKLIDYRLNNIGFVFQAYNLIPVLTAKENVEFIMLLQGIDKKEREDRAIELLESVGLQDRINTRPAQLSGGQQQRVAVARALASHPAFVLADEPTANLDAENISKVEEILIIYRMEQAAALLWVSHDQKQIKRVAERHG